MVFSLHLLSTILITFLQITFSLYDYLMHTHGGIPMSNLEKQRFYRVCISFVTYYSVRIVLIVWACETGKNRAMEIRSTVHDVFNSTSNKHIKYEMRLFSLQISHCDNVFSAKGLTVDATLLTKMAGSIATYLVILIQFLFMSNSCDG
ncbi:putative gustatory receptor 28b [Temnothorax longispinosus]|uniref:putative gustatory receptor 28b n=1 Tax=Temnothorax longispinosus TaxID=300112 RepID=UPI003A9A38BD